MTGKGKTYSRRASLAAALALAAGVVLSAGAASAKYMQDGSVQDGVVQPDGTVNNWKLPTDFVCVVGLHADGSMDIADGVTSSRDCIYLQKGTMNGGTPFDLTGMTTSAACQTAGGAGNDGAAHSWATSWCSKSLTGLDRTQQMCVGIGGTWVTTGKCVAHSRQFKGQDATGTPLAWGTTGTAAGSPGAGFCYANMDTGLGAGSCPSSSTNSSTAFGYVVNGAKCDYQFGINGPVDQALSRGTWSNYKNISGVDVAPGTFYDLSALSMGECLAAGFSWSNWIPLGPGSSVGVLNPNIFAAAFFDLTQQSTDADAGCLHCHSTTVEYNGPAERFKSSYLKTGHKNMLRKVTPGKGWGGPDGLAYTEDSGGRPIDWTTGTIGGDPLKPLYFIFGDWMAPEPESVGPVADVTSYTCGACHSTGFNDSTNPGVQSIGTPGYVAVQPVPPYDSNVAAGNKWDLEGINCSRCHNATVPAVVQGQITGGSCVCDSSTACGNAGGAWSGSPASCSVSCDEIYLTQAACTAISATWTSFGSGTASGFPSTHATSGGMGDLAWGTGRTNLCFGCHQSIAKAWPAQGGAAGGTTQYDPTLIPTGINHGASPGRDFNGHVLGNSFLNSVHARYAGVNSSTANGGIRLNSLGKYDLVDPSGTSEYQSIFKGFMCYQSKTSSSPAKTKVDGTEIKNKTDCEALYGVGAWRADTGNLGATQGTCPTCHDVHNSLFVDEQKEAALRKTCENCHVDNATTGATDSRAPQIVPANINHQMGAGTPFDKTKYESPCVVCHMATQALANGDQNSMPVHLFRISTDPNYDTFPTATQWNAPDNTKDRNAQVAPETYTKADGTTGVYANAIWVDLDLACGQCHGGSLGPGATHNGALYRDKATLAAVAEGIHEGAGVSYPTTFTISADGLTVDVAASVTCNGTCAFTYDWDWGDGSAHGTGATAMHDYGLTDGAGTKTITLTVGEAAGGVGTAIRNVTLYAPLPTPVPGGLPPLVDGLPQDCGAIFNASTWKASFTDSSAPVGAQVVVDWGDGGVSAGVAGDAFSHTYRSAGAYLIVQKVINSTLQMQIGSCSVGASAFTISGTVVRNNPAPPPATLPLGSAVVTVKSATTGVIAKTVYTSGLGTFSVGSLKPDTYWITVTKRGYTFPLPAAVITVGPSSAGTVITANP